MFYNINLFLMNLKMNNTGSFICNRSIFVILFYFVFSFSTKAQISDMASQSYQSLKKYRIEFEIKDEVKVDLELLSKINFDNYIHLRKPDERVEVIDNVTGKTLIIYSEEELQIVRKPDLEFLDYPVNLNGKQKK